MAELGFVDINPFHFDSAIDNVVAEKFAHVHHPYSMSAEFLGLVESTLGVFGADTGKRNHLDRTASELLKLTGSSGSEYPTGCFLKQR